MPFEVETGSVKIAIGQVGDYADSFASCPEPSGHALNRENTGMNDDPIVPPSPPVSSGLAEPQASRVSPGPPASPAPLVSLVGAGPGDPGLLTLRGAERLATADVVLYDGLSNRAMLNHAGRAERICVGKHGQTRIWRQDEVIEEILRHARAGRRVVRLKGGDPAVFARTAEEVEALRAAGIPYEIIPGITAALAAGSYAGIPVTHRRLASAVALVTGHEEPEKDSPTLDWDALARFPGTLVVYMGVTTAHAWTAGLLAGGKDPSTPAAIIRRCSLPDQQVIRCRLDEVADRLTPASRMRPPVIVILGRVTELAETMSWFARRPLFGRTILVTRPADQAEALAGPLRERGATVLVQPAVRIGPPRDWDAVDRAIGQLDRFGTIVFCSRNGVESFLGRLIERGHDLRSLGSLRIAAVGKKTASTLRRFYLRADVVPDRFDAESLAACLIEGRPQPRPVLIVRASRGRDTLAESLRESGWDVEQVAAYDHTDVEAADPEVLHAVQAGKVDWITLTSSGTAKSVARMFAGAVGRCKLASLSPITSETVRELGYDVAAEASPYTIDALVDAIVAAETDKAETDNKE